jgi:glycosyltransferase involved in cell wall biosynthesis
LLTVYYSENDVLILPSLSEPWGLVVEEALNNGLPVIISEKVGCMSEIIVHDYNGIIFSLSEPDNLQKAILRMANVNYYNTLRMNISQMDFEKAAEQQVNTYL